MTALAGAGGERVGARGARPPTEPGDPGPVLTPPVCAPAAACGDTTSDWPWRSSLPALTRFPPGFLERGAELVARDLLGHRIVSDLGGQHTEGVIVEAEAYVGPQDPASHAAERIGRTERNGVMFAAAGVAYIYFIYGMHWCLNVVTGAQGHPSAVLIRALDPLVGSDVMAHRRGRVPLASGPGRLCQALGITGDLNGHDLRRRPLRLLPGWPMNDRPVVATGRIGVRHAADWPLRFHLVGHPAVSRTSRSVDTP